MLPPPYARSHRAPSASSASSSCGPKIFGKKSGRMRPSTRLASAGQGGGRGGGGASRVDVSVEVWRALGLPQKAWAHSQALGATLSSTLQSSRGVRWQVRSAQRRLPGLPVMARWPFFR